MSGPAAPDQELDLAPVANLMQVIMKGLRATQLYLPNNPVYQQAVKSIRGAFAPVWEGFDELEFVVAETDFLVDDKSVLSQPKNESIAWVLYKDGIRSLVLRPMVEEEEIIKFLWVLNKARNLPADAEDDLLTLLWEQDFQYVRYTITELGGEDAPVGKSTENMAGGDTPAQVITKAALEQEVSEAEAAEGEAAKGSTAPPVPTGLVRMEDFDSTLYFLDEPDIEYLKAEIDREYKQDLRGNVLAILFDLLELQAYSTVRAELISIVENFIPYLLAVGDFRSVAYVLRELKIVQQRARELVPEHRAAMEQLPARLSQPDALGQLLQSLDEAVVFPSADELGELFRELRGEALETVLAWLPKLTNQRVRELLDVAAQRLAQAHPEEVSKALIGKEEPIVMEALRLVSRLKLPATIPAVAELLKHELKKVRAAVVDALASIGTQAAMEQIERAIEDSERDVRLTAVRTVSQRGHKNAFHRVEAVVTGKTVRAMDLTEKSAFFEAYGRLGGAAGVQKLSEMLLAIGGFLKRGADPETRACAAMALGKIGTPEAKGILERAAQDKEALVKNAVNKALREIK